MAQNATLLPRVKCGRGTVDGTFLAFGRLIQYDLAEQNTWRKGEMTTERYKVRVTKDHLVFCSGHFISYEGDKCERLHGHNYRTAVEIEGELDENRYVFDFIAIKQRTRNITDELDHRMMLATRNPLIRVEETANSVRVRYREREWVFPREDCVLLPIENTTAELLARYIAGRLLDDLKKHHDYRPEVLRVEVEENIGQSATCELRAS
jgi:6-pyruvoyltetrahydropterin/6-carboxytetrahydropterin synthase